MKSINKRRSLIGLPVVWSIITTILLSLPGSMFQGDGTLFNIPNADKIAHLILFSGLVFLWIFFDYRKNNLKSGALEWFVVVLVSSYGIVMEYVQFYFIPKRSFDKGDIVADVVGSLIGYLFAQWIISWHGRKKSSLKYL
ncbi:MAG TPA: VanZ family protein [Chitinophagaceae bacterium]|nr:VanZ family protein [Chitinophagaceae bacterium]